MINMTQLGLLLQLIDSKKGAGVSVIILRTSKRRGPMVKTFEGYQAPNKVWLYTDYAVRLA